MSINYETPVKRFVTIDDNEYHVLSVVGEWVTLQRPESAPKTRTVLLSTVQTIYTKEGR